TFYERLCPTDDDIWMYTSTIAKGFKTFKPKNTTQKLNFIERAQKSSKTLGAINGQDQNRLYNVYMERITKEGFLQNAGFNALETDAINFLKKSITSIPKEVSVSSYKHTEMLNAPIVFDSPFTVLLRDGIFLRGPVGSFKVLASAFKTAKFAIKMHVAPVLTPKQPLIAYALKYQGRIFKQGIINQQLPFIEFEYDVKEDVQVYELLTTATQQNANWITFCINKIEFN
ncbi:MAG: hypothetical protein KBD31_05160, partial [Proteobacteria bacterium]|nr:hypothetical protein [Pseudomonadota bacterium]